MGLWIRSAGIMGAVCALAAAAPVLAQKYPERNVRLIVPFPTGASQILGLLVSERLGAALGQPVVADFRPGAGGNLGAELAAKAPPDGHTLLLTSPSLTISPSLYKKLNYDTLRDFAPVSMLSTVPNVMVIHPSVPARSLMELVKLARAHPGKLSFGSGGIGSSNHLAGELFKSLGKLNILHVPYKGASIALTHILGGEAEMVIVTVPATIPFITSGRLRGLAVLVPERVPTLPQVPTTAESGMPELVVNTWYGLFAPAGVRPEIVQRLHAEMAKFMQAPEVRKQLAASGLDPATSTPAEFAAFVRADLEKWARVIREANIRVE
ncbi:MAG: tripartite tricarboxylate transporter substrate binding protein [Betaproteobacteria bacterium]|jgi:tripartite-type tricarboxylate transporter receptor subunit TctC